MQKVGAQYALKKLSDYVMAPPPGAEEEGEEAPQAAVSQPVGPLSDIDGQVITDENGERLGIARRVANVAVYVIADTRTGLESHLKESVTDVEGRVFFHHGEDGKLAGLIYVPDPARRPAPVSASRPDDI